MNYAVVRCSNGFFKVESEHPYDEKSNKDNKSAARVAFFQLCATYEN